MMRSSRMFGVDTPGKFPVGTFFRNLPDYCKNLARALGFEPRSKVLETSILPLNYARVSHDRVQNSIFNYCDKARRFMDKVPGRTRVLCMNTSPVAGTIPTA